jgi:hypothetical protein
MQYKLIEIFIHFDYWHRKELVGELWFILEEWIKTQYSV